MHKIVFLVISFFIIFFSACGKTIDADEVDREFIETEIANEDAQAAEDNQAAEDANIFSGLPIDYSEVNAAIDLIIKQRITAAGQFILEYLIIAWSFFLLLPAWLRYIIVLIFTPAAITIIYSYILGIYKNRNEWQKHPDHELSYSYFIYTGNYQRKKSYKEAKRLVFDKKCFIFSLAGLAYRLGNYSAGSAVTMFFLSYAYIPLSILGFFEMILRFALGTICLFIFNLIHRFILFLTRIISMIFIPVARLLDNILQVNQYCSFCYKTVIMPYFVCPECGRVHKELAPGRCGVFFARCACNKKFLPCTAFTGRSRLAAKCNECQNELAAANAKHFSVSIIGGDYSGKTAFAAAFSGIYVNNVNRKTGITVKGKPEDEFKRLIDMFNGGYTEDKADSHAYSLVHMRGKTGKDNLVFYDTLADHIISETYPKSPKYFGYCDGIILIIDPLSLKTVRKEHADTINNRDSGINDGTDIDNFTSQFIRQYFKIRGHSTGNMCEVPFAVVINKTDVDFIKKETGHEAVNEVFNRNPLSQINNLGDARDFVCREYLVKIGLSNLLNNIEATFSNVGFFPVSAIGHSAQNGKAFNPAGVIDPVEWIAENKKSRLLKYLKIANNKG